MRSETFDRTIFIERATTAQNEYGEEVSSWATIATVQAAKLNVSDLERVQAGEVSAQISLRFQIRWDSSIADISPKDRVVFEGKTYDVVAVKELERRVGIEISAATRAD